MEKQTKKKSRNTEWECVCVCLFEPKKKDVDAKQKINHTKPKPREWIKKNDKENFYSTIPFDIQRYFWVFWLCVCVCVDFDIRKNHSNMKILYPHTQRIECEFLSLSLPLSIIHSDDYYLMEKKFCITCSSGGSDALANRIFHI